MKLSKYFRGVGEEARRIRWPDQKTLWKYVGIVLLISIVTALFLYLFDYLAIQINRAFSNAYPKSSASSSSSGTAAMAMIPAFLSGWLGL